ncbi:MAG: PIG-L family deacetylase [Oscillospiraceae bacterium]|nr:PIG-L family deacetylase [Oscillospiraceae bacterium]
MKKVCVFALVLLLAGLAACGYAQPAQEPVETKVQATFTPSPTATPSPTPGPTAEPTPVPVPYAREITAEITLSDNYGGYFPYLTDGDPETWIAYKRGTYINISCQEEIGFLYICWYRAPRPYIIHINGGGYSAGESEYLYEYYELPESATEVQLSFSTTENLSDIHVYGKGAVPDDIQRWSPPLEEADVLVFPTHADDETVFFGAAIASCLDRGLDVQVCYMCEHNTDLGYKWHTRTQELLNALWALGMRNYPVLGPFRDEFVTTWKQADKAFGFGNVIGYQVEQIRRFKPFVVLGHDMQGEYGHAAHMMNSQALPYAVKYAADAKSYAASARKWGVWDVPKLYLHLATENRITLDVETPLESYGGRTAFEVACDAMECHQSQLQYEHRPMLYDKDYPYYDCTCFGLVRSLVGEDTGNDIMEHIEK